MKKSKKYLEASKKIEKSKLYTKEEAIALVKETSVTSFDSSVEVALRLNLDTKKADQQLREIAEIKLPDLNAYDVEQAMKIVAGTAKNMGVEVKED